MVFESSYEQGALYVLQLYGKDSRFLDIEAMATLKICSWRSRYKVYVYRFGKDTETETTTPWINSLRLVINRVDD